MSSIKELKRTFDQNAQQDALYTVCSDQAKAGGRWEVGEFLSTGEKEIGRVMDYISGLEVPVNHSGAALDFGCGVGRLTQAIAKRFQHCTGVDVSSIMVEKANSLNKVPDRCDFRLNQVPNLEQFEKESFSFIYSNIALQHIPPQHAAHYLSEFVRVLAPGGITVFQTADSMSGSLLLRVRANLQLHARFNGLFGVKPIVIHFLTEKKVRRALGPVKIVDVCYTNATNGNFNGDIVFLKQRPQSGAISKQYCVVKP
jgi:ubiquinone/menaquinone biosynthesis C-methylase UbiE